ncbi:MAG: hypothetical protein KAW09_09375, partial [Thermoplasmata archaeon]|nr:hypothetical protein [Thermoplasmata archaeon]
LGCDRLIMSKIGKLGPLDPIVWHPNRGWVPVRAITDIPRTLEQDLDAFGCKHDKLKPKEILSIKAESIIKPMSEQADPYIHAAYSRSADVARKYGEKVFLAKGIGKERSGRCLNQLITVYPIHAFELDADDLKDISTYHNVIDVVDPSEDIEDEMLDLLLTFHVLGIKCAQKNEPLNQAIIGISEPEEQHPEENGKRCVAKTKSGKRCKNRAAGESKYCGIHKKK